MGWFSGLFSKVAGSAVGSFFGTYKIAILGGLAALLAGLITFYIYGAEKAKGERDVLRAQYMNAQQTFEAMELTIAINEKSLGTCLAVNQANAVNLAAQAKKVTESETTVLLLQVEAEHTLEGIRNENERLKNQDTECRTVDESLPDWFTDGLWDDYPLAESGNEDGDG